MPLLERPPHRRAGCLRALAAATALACGASLPAEAQWSRPAWPQSPPATATAPLELPAQQRPPPLPIHVAPTVEEALAYTDEEKEILKDVRDGDGQWDASALYVLLRRAEMLPEGRQTMEEAEEPNPKSFWTEPQRYRARLVRVTGRLYGPAEKLSDRIPWTRYWGGRPVHVLYLQVAGAAEPVVVYLTRTPPQNPPQRLRVAGLFYKLITAPERAETGDPSKTHTYPILVAKTIYARPWGGGVPAGTAAMLGAVLVLVVLFFMLRRYAVRPSPGAARRYRPKPLGNAPGPEEQNSDEVDAELRRQVNAYRHQRRADVEPRDANDKDHSC